MLTVGALMARCLYLFFGVDAQALLNLSLSSFFKVVVGIFASLGVQALINKKIFNILGCRMDFKETLKLTC